MIKVDASCKRCEAPIRVGPGDRWLCYACRCDQVYLARWGYTPIGYYAEGRPIYAG